MILHIHHIHKLYDVKLYMIIIGRLRIYIDIYTSYAYTTPKLNAKDF